MRRLSSALLAFGVTAAAGLATAARAADLPVPGAPVPSVYAPALYNWTGLYLGGHVGANILTDDVSAASTGGLLTAGPAVSYNPVGVIGGVQFGANYQAGAWVLGVEGTFAWSNVSGSATAVSPLVAGDSVRSTSALHWLATATGRIGYAFNTVLIYAKGGGAWADVEYFQDVIGSTGGFFPTTAVISTQSIGDTRNGWTAGAGVEYGLTEHVSARLEYDFVDFGSKTYTFMPNAALALAPPTQAMSFSSYVHEITVAVSYRFN